MEDMDVEQHQATSDEEMEDMELGYAALPQDPADEDGILLMSNIQTLCERYNVPVDFQVELHTLLRLDERKLYKPSMDILMASAVAEVRNELTFQLTKHFLVFKRVAESKKAMKVLDILDVKLNGVLLQYHSFVRSLLKAPCSKLYMKCEEIWKDPGVLDEVDEALKPRMAQLLWFDAKSKTHESSWAFNVADGLVEIAEVAVFKAESPQLGQLMRREVDGREVTVRHYRDRFAHLFECSQVGPDLSESVFKEKAPLVKGIVNEAGYLLYKSMAQQAERVSDDSRFAGCYKPAQMYLYEYCISRVKELHAEPLEDYETLVRAEKQSS